VKSKKQFMKVVVVDEAATVAEDVVILTAEAAGVEEIITVAVETSIVDRAKTRTGSSWLAINQNLIVVAISGAVVEATTEAISEVAVTETRLATVKEVVVKEVALKEALEEEAVVADPRQLTVECNSKLRRQLRQLRQAQKSEV